MEWKNRYSQTDKPDNHGRWARLLYHKGYLICWVSRIVTSTEPFELFVAKTFFPISGSDCPEGAEKFYSFEAAKEWCLKQWDKFFKTINDEN